MSTEGRKGGESRPGSAKEIKKLPQSRCQRCRLEACQPVVVDGKCRNTIACDMRLERARRKGYVWAQ